MEDNVVFYWKLSSGVSLEAFQAQLEAGTTEWSEVPRTITKVDITKVDVDGEPTNAIIIAEQKRTTFKDIIKQLFSWT